MEKTASSPGPSPHSKWQLEKPLAKAAEILHESWSILSSDTRWNGFFGHCFQRLAALFVFCNRKLLFKQNEDISSCLHDEILTNFWSHFGSLGQGFLRPPFWMRRRPWGRGCGKNLFFLWLFTVLFTVTKLRTVNWSCGNNSVTPGSLPATTFWPGSLRAQGTILPCFGQRLH